MTRRERVVLDLLQDGQSEQYGLEIVRGSNGMISRGAVYILLHKMEEKGLVQSRREKYPSVPRLPRRLYKITSLGMSVSNERQ